MNMALHFVYKLIQEKLFLSFSFKDKSDNL